MPVTQGQPPVKYVREKRESPTGNPRGLQTYTFSVGCVICAFLYLKPIGRMKRSNLGALRVKSGPTKVGFVTTRFHAFLAVFFPVLTTLNISSSAMPLTLGSGTLNLAAFSARLFLICVDSAFAFVGFALSSRYEGIGFAGSFSAAAPLTLRSSCALIVFRSWIFS